jgi:dipeptidyl aminopeptidase/acylaminoacyl peptidase
MGTRRPRLDNGRARAYSRAMSRVPYLFLLLSLLPACTGSAARPGSTPSTPRTAMYTPTETDIPTAVPGEVGLAGQALPDITRFLNVRAAGAPSLSPDGARVAFRTSITGAPQLWVVDARGGWPTQLTFGEPVTFHAWSPAGDWLIYGTDRGGNEREGFYLISPDGTMERELLPPSDAFRVFGGFSPDGGRIAYSTTERNGRDFDVHVLDLASGEDREVFRGSFGFYVAAWRPDGKALILSETRGEDGNDVHLLDLATGAARVLFKPEEPARFQSFAWKPDGSGFYVATNLDRDFSGLAWYDVRQGALSFVDTPAHDVESVALTRDGRYLAWTTNQGGYSRVHGRDLAGGKDLAAPALPPGVASLEVATAAPVMALDCSGPQVPGDIWIWRLDSGRLERATHSAAAGLDLSRMVAPAHHDFPARDGVVLHGLLYLPPGLPAGAKPPVLVAVHGGPTGQARPRFQAVHQYLLTRGIAVFDFNFRGSTGYGKTFTRLDDRRLRPNAVRDLEDAVAWLTADGRVDASRAAIMGGSYGGYLTNAALTTFPDLFRAGVSIVGVSNWITALEGASPALKASDRLEYGDIDDPDDREFFRQLSPLTHADRVRAPLMVMHGANDPRDPVSESDQLVGAIRARGVDVEYLRFPDEGHGIRKLSNRIIAYRRVARFLEKHLGLAQ